MNVIPFAHDRVHAPTLHTITFYTAVYLDRGGEERTRTHSFSGMKADQVRSYLESIMELGWFGHVNEAGKQSLVTWPCAIVEIAPPCAAIVNDPWVNQLIRANDCERPPPGSHLVSIHSTGYVLLETQRHIARTMVFEVAEESLQEFLQKISDRGYLSLIENGLQFLLPWPPALVEIDPMPRISLEVLAWPTRPPSLKRWRPPET